MLATVVETFLQVISIRISRLSENFAQDSYNLEACLYGWVPCCFSAEAWQHGVPTVGGMSMSLSLQGICFSSSGIIIETVQRI